MAILEVNNIEVRYMNVILVLRGVTLEVPEGAIVALLGSNGAGKSTTLKAISGLLRTEEGKVTDGNIRFEGKRIENRDPEDIAHMGILQVLEGREIFEHLTVEENLRLGSYLGNGKDLKRNLDRIYGYMPRLKDLENQTSGYLSGGEQQMLVLGRGLMANPKLLMIDEASLGLAPLLQQEISSIISNINAEEKISMLLVEQNAQTALTICQYAYVMENGRIVLDGPSSKLIENEDIREFYMGLSAVGETKSYRDVKHYRRRKRWLA